MMFTTSVSVLLLLAFPVVISEVVDFSKCSEFFFKGKPPVIPDMIKNNQYKTICQRYENSYRFATLYDTTNRIPVFSAYKFTADKQIERPDTWMNEPQLEVSSDEMGMPYENQATDEDFNSANSYKVNRGHLFPSCHSGDEVIANSTFTYTNIVPQKISFNSGSWNRMEIETLQEMSKNCRDSTGNKVLAHVLVGAVPGNNKLNERVNIPSFMWMTFCCYNINDKKKLKLYSKAYWAPNKDDNDNTVRINAITLEKLEENLNPKNIKDKQLFDNHCK